MTGAPMPYVMDKGPYLSVLEDILANTAKRVQFLAGLEGGTELSSLIGLDSTSLDGDGKGPDDRVAVLNGKWFGMTLEAGNWVKQPQDFPTGFWQGYQGDPEAILRAALIRGIEVSLGVDHGAHPVVHTREWPIEIIWVCQGPFFQCWVGWQRSQSGGHVTITITTPAADGLRVKAKITRTTVKPEYKLEPANNAWQAARGLWVFGHEDYMKSIGFSTIGTKIGTKEIPIPVPVVQWSRKSTDVVCVAPAEWEGGVLAAGRQYTP